ncbi:MAG: hypothetical protein AB4911_14450 [Oscillochloridaceae bacterium umkhey_bin13]
MTHHEPTIASILRSLAYEYQNPVEERQVLDQVLKRRPSSAKNPYATIRERLRWDGLTLGWLRLSRRQLVPLRVVLQGLRFRCLPRADDLASGMLPLVHLQPFAGLRSYSCLLRDETGAIMPFLDPDEVNSEGLPLPTFDLRAFFARTGFQVGDSLLVTVTSTEPLTLLITHEPASAFRSASVTEQDTALIAAINERVNRAPTALVPCDEVILPIFATAAWRDGYPGTPWQHLVLRDPRLQLVDDIFLTNQRLGALHLFGTDEVFAQTPRLDQEVQAADQALLNEIDALQRDLRRARQLDAEAGLWGGQVQRASATFGGVDGSAHGAGLFGGHDDDLLAGSWELDDTWDQNDDFEGETIDPDDPEVIQMAQERMFELLPADAAAQLQQARPEEAELIIAQHLNMLLVRAPELFPRLDLAPPDEQEWGIKAFDDEDNDEWPEVWDDEALEDFGNEDEVVSDAFAYSTDLIAQFRDYLVEMGKSSATARARGRDLHLYADFLASYYGRTLAEGDYATLDECLFFYYPRRVLNTSPRQVRAICTAIKQLYAFLKQRGVIDDDRFAEALWRRRDQAVRVVEIYDRIASDSPNFELLFERLFLPYTE